MQKMLAHHDVVIPDAAQRIAVILPWMSLAARSRPGWRGDLQDKAIAIVVPHDHSFRMAPRRKFGLHRVPIELVVPHDVVVTGMLVHLGKSCAQRIGPGRAHATAALDEAGISAGGKDILLAMAKLVFVDRPAEEAFGAEFRRLAGIRAAGKGFRVELENEQPINRLVRAGKGCGSGRWSRFFIRARVCPEGSR